MKIALSINDMMVVNIGCVCIKSRITIWKRILIYNAWKVYGALIIVSWGNKQAV